MHQLEFANQKNNSLEFRPWPEAKRLKNKFREEDGSYSMDDTFYIGIRIKDIGEIPFDERQIDLTVVRENFFKRVYEEISDSSNTNYE